MAGNKRFATGRSESPRRGPDRVRELACGQAPYAAILGCADSRVPPEILFDEGLGDVFTVRVAGNVASLEAIASLEYAVAALGARVATASVVR
jgi:carbonic anhydrase